MGKWSPKYQGNICLFTRSWKTVSVSGHLCFPWHKWQLLYYYNAFSDLIWFLDFRHALPACNELRQSRAIMSHDLKSNSSLDAKKSHLITGYPRLFLLKIWMFSAKKELFGKNERIRLKSQTFQMHHVFFRLNLNFHIFVMLFWFFSDLILILVKKVS